MNDRFSLDRVHVCFGRPKKEAATQVGGAAASIDDSHVLRDVSVDFEPGTITSLVGPSGCGKTTLLRVLAGLQTATGGAVVRPPKIGFVFQKPALLPWLTTRQNVRLPLEIGGQTGHDGRVDDLLERVGLGDSSDLFPRQLSGGMQMRVSLARALVTQPTLLLLDEPLAALDEILREQLGELLLTLWSDQRFTAVMVTHNIAESIWLAHRVLIMDGGRISHDRSVDLDWPRTPAIQSSEAFGKIAASIANTLRQSSSSGRSGAASLTQENVE